MNKILILVFSAIIGSAGSTTLAAAGLFSAKGVVIAILADDLYVGEAEGDLSGAGTLAIQSQSNPDLTCTGEFTSSAKLGGSGKLRCSNGTTGTFQFQRVTLFRGYGVGTLSLGTMSFAYGFATDESAPYLRLPEGKVLTQRGTVLRLADL